MNMRIALAVLASGVMLGACNGWPDSAPYQEAMDRPEKYQTYAAAAEPGQTISFAERHWLVQATPENLRGATLLPVGAAGAAGLYAPAGANTPYPALYTPAGGAQWYRVVPID